MATIVQGAGQTHAAGGEPGGPGSGTARHAGYSWQRLPEMRGDKLSLVGHRKGELKAWVDGLPIMNTAECGKKLYQTVKEMTQLRLDESLRFELLEILEPAVRNLLNSLSKHTVNQPALSSATARKASAFVQAMHAQMALNYKIVVVETFARLREGKVGFLNLGKGKARHQAATAIQRVIRELGYVLLDAGLQYTSVPDNTWADLNGLFYESLQQGLADEPIDDPYCRHGQKTTIRHSYLRVALLIISQPQKLRQVEIQLLYVHSETWAGYLTVDERQPGSLLVCNPDDNPPGYHHRIQPTPASWYIHSQSLLQQLRGMNENTSEVPAGLVAHLLEVWRDSRQRMFERHSCEKRLRICLGLSATHYYISGKQEFQQMLAAPEQKPPVNAPAFVFALEEEVVAAESVDPWHISFQAIDSLPKASTPVPETSPPAQTYPAHDVVAVNRSPAGYGICWEDDVPPGMHPGDVIGVCEAHNDAWHVGLMHWIRQPRCGRCPDRGCWSLQNQPLKPVTRFGCACMRKPFPPG